MQRAFGRLEAQDPKDHGFLLRSLVSAEARAAMPVAMDWEVGPVLDQGSTSQCVGYGWRQFLSSAPLMTTTGPAATEIYLRAQQLDEWPGEAYDGTSVRAGAKALTEWGHLSQYHWGFVVQDVIDFVLTSGPVVAGTDWLSGMDDPIDGVIRAEGISRGGHCYLIKGADTSTGFFRMINSWGTGWADGGQAYLSFDGFARLLELGGEACFGTEVVVGEPTPVVPEPTPSTPPGCLMAMPRWLRALLK